MPPEEKTLPVERDRRTPRPRCAILVGCDPQTLGLVFPVDGPTTIGRESGVTLRLAYEGVSRLHAKVEVNEERAKITDMGSTNGVAVNGVEGAEHPLHSGDRIQLGTVELEFRLETPEGLTATQQRADARARLQVLSDREREVAQLVAQGLRSSEISARMHITTRTVNTHLENIYARLDIRTRPALAGLVARAGGE